MARPRPRPRFSLTASLSPGELLAHMRERLRTSRSVKGLVIDPGRIELTPLDEQQNLWSPQLTIDVSPADAGSQLHCRFGPHPHVWTMYIAIHATGALCTLAALVYGLSQHLAGQTPWALWFLPAAPLLAALVWALAFIGQSLGAEQMYQLRRYLEASVAPTKGPPRDT